VARSIEIVNALGVWFRPEISRFTESKVAE
jgi:hypothetical protein